MSTDDLLILFFENQAQWRSWLTENHQNQSGIWLKFFKKDTGITSLHYPEALDEALCFGWIDGQSKSIDDKAYMQKFTPRRIRSMWSKRNTEHIARLTKLGKMHPSGLAEVERAKNDGRWARAYDSPANTKPSADFLKNKKAAEFYKTLNKTNTFAITFRINSAKKAETRQKRIKTLIDKLARGEKLY
jgi:uncharacterized protein YdeI (YjbR/CyaY-like superfamily)